MSKAPSSRKSTRTKGATNIVAERKSRPLPRLETPTFLSSQATDEIAAALTALLADSFALYLKTKNFHWHVSGPHFRDYHLMFDEQAAEIFAMSDPLAERARKVGGTTLRSIGHIGRLQRLLDNDAGYVEPADMLAELMEDNKQLAAFMRQTHDLCDEYDDVATESLLEEFIDQTEKRVWFLFEASRGMQTSGH
ncbi:Dps family protein [Microvirga lotononidis]|uniref:DNA-binding ferritin-like protein (Oxidative damage protectant) n=1 Tax=Microvirga lotononidis TaxID=864069 RepID=I4YXG3_9HYPH|nr:DNA starvation/stationary phase protection protein [Microvirga lotononidis]EIM28655.1 DNA-binding ferritin-like protein (oxidative damage protectant) [Microvirga lotononidis]WQO25602.1 DNA starvation/stationary phase protection protein [Microvirga lotononidis]